jgi:hypothetical protein
MARMVHNLFSQSALPCLVAFALLGKSHYTDAAVDTSRKIGFQAYNFLLCTSAAIIILLSAWIHLHSFIPRHVAGVDGAVCGRKSGSCPKKKQKMLQACMGKRFMHQARLQCAYRGSLKSSTA